MRGQYMKKWQRTVKILLMAAVLCSESFLPFLSSSVEATGNTAADEATAAYEDTGAGTGAVSVAGDGNSAEMLVVLAVSSSAEDLSVKEEDTVLDTDNVGGMDIVTVSTPADSLDESMAVYGSMPEVASVQPNYEYCLMDAESPMASYVDDTDYSKQWDLLKTASVNLPEAWDLARCSGTVKVGVIDTGVAEDHPDLAANIDTADSYDVVNDTSALTDTSSGTSFNGHGTHVAGIISAAADNGIGIAGVSYNAQLCCYNVFENETVNGVTKYTAHTASLLKAYNRAVDAGCRVINMSVGGYNETDQLLETAIENAAANGIVTVCAGGNGNGSNTGYTTAVFPGDLDACISVVPTSQSNVYLPYADYNQYKDIAAPGGSIYSTVPYTVSSTGYGIKGGSSMAAPFVSGVVALLVSADPTLTTDEIKNILYSTATDLGDTGWDEHYGYGLINVEGALEALNPADEAFTDVYQNTWYYSYVQFLYSRKIMTGYASSLFGTGDDLSRGQFSAILYRLEGSPDENYSAVFEDVPDGAFFTKAVMWAQENGIVTGYGNGKFGPADPINREQIAVMMYRYAQYKGYDVTSSADITSFPDNASVSAFALTGMKWAVGKKLITGTGGMLDPQGSAVRAQCAAIITRFMQYYLY